MKVVNLRKYGKAPYDIVLVHGGPGAAGEMQPVARKLESIHGVLEPLQTAHTISGQLKELKGTLEAVGDSPYTLVGYSWGAMLSFMFAAKHPELVKKLILVSSAVFEESYAANIMQTRFERCTPGDRQEFQTLLAVLNNSKDKKSVLLKLEKLISKADAFDPLPNDADTKIDFSYDIYESVWEEAKILRSSGQLLRLGTQIKCPVVAIHGDYDPHPADGVQQPLLTV